MKDASSIRCIKQADDSPGGYHFQFKNLLNKGIRKRNKKNKEIDWEFWLC